MVTHLYVSTHETLGGTAAELQRGALRRPKPNAGHEAIAALGETKQVTVVTQNIDGLHQEAGSARVIELHGSEASCTCTQCGAAVPREAVLEGMVASWRPIVARRSVVVR